jgi:lipid-binding SYLF domain-containing protein
MKKTIGGTVILAVFLAFLSASVVNAASERKETEKIDSAVEVLKQIESIPEKSIPPALLNNAGAIAIIPGVIKAGFIVGGRYGTGILVVRDEKGGWSDPTFITITGGSIGWQIGVESIDIILVFKHSRSIENIVKGKFTLGANASVAAGPVGRQAEAATDVQLRSEIYSYSRSKGLFAGLALEGAALQIDDDANTAFYGEPDIRARDILSNKIPKTPPEVEKLKNALYESTSIKTKD